MPRARKVQCTGEVEKEAVRFSCVLHMLRRCLGYGRMDIEGKDVFWGPGGLYFTGEQLPVWHHAGRNRQEPGRGERGAAWKDRRLRRTVRGVQ